MSNGECERAWCTQPPGCWPQVKIDAARAFLNDPNNHNDLVGFDPTIPATDDDARQLLDAGWGDDWGRVRFDTLKIGDQFTRGDDLVWCKNQSFTAYGFCKTQNAAAYFPKIGPWHYDKVPDDELVIPVSKDGNCDE